MSDYFTIDASSDVLSASVALPETNAFNHRGEVRAAAGMGIVDVRRAPIAATAQFGAVAGTGQRPRGLPL